MKTLVVVPHARTNWSLVTDEYNRKPADMQDCFRIVDSLDEVIFEPVCLLGICSRPVASTLATVAMCFSQHKETIWHNVLSNQMDEHINLIQRAPTEFSTAIVCGHNPGIGDLARLFTQEDFDLPSGTMVGIDLDVDNWSEVSTFTRGDVAWMWSLEEGFTRRT